MTGYKGKYRHKAKLYFSVRRSFQYISKHNYRKSSSSLPQDFFLSDASGDNRGLGDGPSRCLRDCFDGG